MTQMQRQLRTAQRTLQREAEFLGTTLTQLLDDLDKYPLAYPIRTVEAFKTYRELAYL